MKEEVSKYFFVHDGHKYAMNLDGMKKLCFVSSGQDSREKEITESYTLNEKNEMELSNKIDREIKSYGNPQNDVIVYDMLKLLIDRLLDNEKTVDEELDFVTALCLNSLLYNDVIVEVE